MFENIKINERTAKELETAILNDTLSHAVIIEGADEETRLKTAKQLAAALICDGENKPCGHCSNCKKSLCDSHADIHILTKDEKSANIKVDEIRALKQQAQLFPNEAKYSIFIISEAQFMGVQSQNALLKIFEEPASHIKFILTCDSKSALLETIVSRGSSYSLSNSISENISDEKHIKAKELAGKLLDCFCKSDEYHFLVLTSEFQKDKDLFLFTLNYMIEIIRDALMINCSSKELISDSFETAKALSMNYTASKMLQFIELLQSLLDQTKANANFNLLATRLCSNLYLIKN
ncbi:MAG: hypothetical protein ACI4W6_06920 [Acutalibacteraceae bacterium]